MRWKDFKEWAESNGVNDDTRLAYEDMNFGGEDCDLHITNFNINTDDNVMTFDSKFYQDID